MGLKIRQILKTSFRSQAHALPENEFEPRSHFRNLQELRSTDLTTMIKSVSHVQHPSFFEADASVQAQLAL
jgi:hypothetical protein